MLTLATYKDIGVLVSWRLNGERQPQRYFYYTGTWNSARMLLPGSTRKGLEKDLSQRGRVEGAVEEFVAGVPREKLITNLGFASSPPFKRMENRKKFGAPIEGIERVAYLRTEHTRSFGFFSHENLFCAVTLELVSRLKEKKDGAGNRLYRAHAEKVTKFISRLEADQVDGKKHPDQLVTP